MEWPHLSIFPRMTLCEIYIREVGTVHPYLIQCVLRINIFNEVIFILVWHWLIFIIFLTSGDFLLRSIGFILTCSNCQRKLFALKYLELIHLQSMSQSKSAEERANLLKETANMRKDVVGRLTDKYLFVIVSDKARKSARKRARREERETEFNLFERFCQLNFNNDTIFALRLIERNASSLIVSEIIEHLWLKFKYLNLIHSTGENDYMLKKLLVLRKKPMTVNNEEVATIANPRPVINNESAAQSEESWRKHQTLNRRTNNSRRKN